MVQNDPDRYTRGQAITAYVRSAGQDAIPLLKELFLHDRTESEYVAENSPGRFFISALARGELALLTEQEFRNTPYMQKIDALLANNGLSREKVQEIGGKTIKALYDRKDKIQTFQKARVHIPGASTWLFRFGASSNSGCSRASIMISASA